MESDKFYLKKGQENHLTEQQPVLSVKPKVFLKGDDLDFFQQKKYFEVPDYEVEEILHQNQIDNMRALYRDLNFLLDTLKSDQSIERVERNWGKEYLQSKIEEMSVLKEEISNFCKINKISLNENDLKNWSPIQVDKREVMTKVYEITEERKENKNQQEFFISQDLSISQKNFLLYNLHKMEQKLNLLEETMGDYQIQGDQTLIEDYIKEYEELKSLDIKEVKKNVEKLELVDAELEQMCIERRMNYFSQYQKEELKKFF